MMYNDMYNNFSTTYNGCFVLYHVSRVRHKCVAYIQILSFFVLPSTVRGSQSQIVSFNFNFNAALFSCALCAFDKPRPLCSLARPAHPASPFCIATLGPQIVSCSAQNIRKCLRARKLAESREE